jgi:hypothetical protein
VEKVRANGTEISGINTQIKSTNLVLSDMHLRDTDNSVFKFRLVVNRNL